MVPLILFLGIWVVLVLIFGLLALITTGMSIRFGITGFVTLMSNAVFMGVALGVIGFTAWYLIGVDWSPTVTLFPSTISINSI